MKIKNFIKTAAVCLLLGNTALSNAQVTIGSRALPQATLDIIGDTLNVHGKGFRLIDGNQSTGKVLTCRENGIGTWEYVALYRIAGTKPPTSHPPLQFALNYNGIESEYIRQTGASITLPPGKWEVRVNTLISIVDVSTSPTHQHNLTANDFAWVRSTFTDSPTIEGVPYNEGVITPDIVTTESGSFTSGRVSGPKTLKGSRSCFGLIQGTVIIHNKSKTDKTYYYVAGYFDTSSAFTAQQVVLRVSAGGGESSIVATPVL